MTQKFTFAQRVEGFDNHIEHSIRGYTDLWNDILYYSEYFVEDYSNIVDIGCSTGKLLREMINQNTFAENANYFGVELESDFYNFFDDDETKFSNLKYHRGDILDFNFQNCSFITSIFTLQFVLEKHRRPILQQIYNGLNYGGAFIVAEKTISEYSKIQDIRTFTHYDYKRNYFTTDDILNKEKELRHMLKSNTRSELTSMLSCAGFNKIDSFWQNHSFVAFIAIK